MNFDWYKIFNINEFNLLNVFSKTYRLNLQPLGQKDILVTKGNKYGILYQDVFLVAELNQKNPFVKDGFAIAVAENNDVYLGIEIED